MNIEKLTVDLEQPVEVAHSGANVGGYPCFELALLVIGIIIG
jgi:hypothetical protein